jgi:hypothetical protein
VSHRPDSKPSCASRSYQREGRKKNVPGSRPQAKRR